jgi:hypothetical protein
LRKGGVAETLPQTIRKGKSMQIICTKAFQFLQTEIKENPSTKESIAVIKQTFKITPSSRPQVVPDWIKEDELFDLGVKDGSITEVMIVSKNEAKPKKEVPQTGWGATASGLAK